MTIKQIRAGRERSTILSNINNNSITHLIKTLATRQDKVDLITERNPLHYMFGEYLATRKYDEKYEDFISRQYIGRIK